MVEDFSLTDGTTREAGEGPAPADVDSSRGELILYPTEDGLAQIQLRASEGTVWLTQREMAELFQTSAQAITQLGACAVEADGAARAGWLW